MTDNDSVPTTRREVWLHIALAVAQGMPEPELRFSDHDYKGTPYLYLNFDRHEDARRWAERLDAATTRSYDRPDLGRSYVEAIVVLTGWRYNIVGNEPLRTEAEQDLAAQVVSAILDPDAELTTAGGAA